MRIFLLISLLAGVNQAAAYDGRIGDAVIDVRSGLVGSSLDLSQMVLPRWRGGVTLTHGWLGRSIPFGLGIVVGYEHHRRGYAWVPRAQLSASMGLLADSGLGVNAQMSGGFLWYMTRQTGVGLNLGGNLWGNDLRPDLTVSVVKRW